MKAILTRPLALALAVALPATLISGCATNRGANKRIDTSYVARDVDTLYLAAKDRLDRGAYKESAALFDEVERQHPYSPWARQAMLMSAYAHYLDGSYSDAIQGAQRFIALHPGNKDTPYAFYLVAMSYYEQISDVTRDQKITQQALEALGDVARRYPNTKYAADARLKLDLVNDHLAGKDMEIGRFYQRSAKWLAASLRFRSVVDNYQTTTHAPEALYRLTESYLALGLPQEAQKSAAVLGVNYPGSKWYERAYDLMRRHTPAVAATTG